ncbi:ABC transporter ATP-binding protein [Paenarthrobacter nitroguajacolicus]|uniref:ABC transporter ATP-binding protein n=1 Tax=Paenarthrobacter nitroguajacolicus TaxID=211146 RepID=A0A558GWI2_PAENT|nr:ABC transporter ATP-binding protein [Paenarthrobacter nitroguajacolicus]TVU61233.1 ABC transporter ATP-binding protein [Paenarthrobacter nitroguajacolicus]
MLSVQQLQINGRRDDLLPATSLQVRPGELLLVAGEGQDQRTALALALSGRMKPSNGILSWDNTTKTKKIRRASALVDSPGVNEPEQHLSVRDLVTEDLSLIPRRYRGALLSKPWLKVNSFEDIAGLWIEQLPAGRRLELLTALALADPATDLLVIDTPDRHSADPAAWLPRLQALASDDGRPLAVVAVVAALPDNWTGPAAVIGNSVSHPPEPEAQPATSEPKAKHAAEPVPETPETPEIPQEAETPAAPTAAEPESQDLQRTAK